MKRCLKTEIRRARPLLGTIVDLACDGSPNDIDRGFSVVEKVHRLTSFYDSASDVSRMNRDAFRKSIRVHPWTWRVLQAALEFSRESDGVFDITVAPILAKWNFLPESDFQSDPSASWRDVVLEKHDFVRFRRPLIVDLGGIAKGFAVDRAVEALQRAGASSGIVNAGGDLRVFGSISRSVHLRNPTRPMLSAGQLKLRDRAVATSALYFSRRNRRGPLIDGQTRDSIKDFVSVTISAADCMTADALSKVVFARREKAAALLERHRADALLLEGSGVPRWMFQAHAA